MVRIPFSVPTPWHVFTIIKKIIHTYIQTNKQNQTKNYILPPPFHILKFWLGREGLFKLYEYRKCVSPFFWKIIQFVPYLIVCSTCYENQISSSFFYTEQNFNCYPSTDMSKYTIFFFSLKYFVYVAVSIKLIFFRRSNLFTGILRSKLLQVDRNY